MATLLDPHDIYDRGLDDLDSLRGPERLVFMLQDFDNMMEMEGWEHFFLYEHHFAWYEEMQDWLNRIGAASSLAVLSSYETYVHAAGFELSPAGIEAMLEAQEDAETQEGPDWCERYCDLREERWTAAAAFLVTQGFELQME